MAIICIDFDGTCVTHEFPDVGKDIGAVPVLKKLVKAGHQLILYTMRSEKNTLDDATHWFANNDIPLYGINENPEQKSWTLSPKPFAHLYIDDSALGAPLKYDYPGFILNRPFIDWEKVENVLLEQGFIE